MSVKPSGALVTLKFVGFFLHFVGSTLLEKKMQLGTLFVPYLEVRTLGGKGSQKGSLHVHEPKKVPYIITKNDSKEPKKVLKMVLKTQLEPFREP